MACALWCRDTSSLPLPGAVAAFSPWLDLTQSLPAWHVNKAYDFLPSQLNDPKHTRLNLYVAHDHQICDPYVSPIYAKVTEVELPPMMFHVGGKERVRDDGVLFRMIFGGGGVAGEGRGRVGLEVYQDMVVSINLFVSCDQRFFI